MKSFALLLTALLAQEPAAPEAEPSPVPVEPSPVPAEPSPVPADDAAAATEKQTSAPVTPITPAEAPSPPRPKGADEVARKIKRLGELPQPERDKLVAQLRKEYGASDINPILPPGDLDLQRFSELSAVDQARVTARHFFTDLIAADTPGMLAHCGLPFMMEDRRIDRAEDLRSDWVKSLRSKRTDLLVLYDVEVLSPAEMEKKYGTPPRRLSSWGWRGANAYLAVGNLSGHAMVLLLRPVGAAWQIVGFHD